jgi:hypothetical protein
VKASVFLNVILLVPGPLPCAGQDSGFSEAVEAGLRRIPNYASPEENESAFDSVLAVMYQHPALAAGLLVGVLEPVAPGKHPKTPRVVWYIRALRSLTGLDFKAPTKARLTEDERERLHPDTAGNTPFFTWDMGWDVIWVAPKDAQLAIIRKWRAWFAAEGKTFRYVNDRNQKDWYF